LPRASISYRRQPLLVGIVACALFSNMAFFALIAMFVPFALGPLGLNAAQAGAAQPAMGIGSLAAARLATIAMARLSHRLILVFRPASSMLASVIPALSPHLAGTILRLAGPVAEFLLIGFGPILWFVCQNSIRQLDTPPGLLGRVGSVIQAAIYGMRSVGVLLGSIVADRLGFDAAMVPIVGLFAASLLAVLLSSLARLRTLPARLVSPLTHENPAWEARGFRQWAAARWGALLRATVTGRHGRRLVTGQKGLALAGEQGAALACHPPALGGASPAHEQGSGRRGQNGRRISITCWP
jgi:hypothetical protein